MPAALALRVVEHQVHIYRRFWRGPVIGYILAPVMFLGAMGLGVGSLVKQDTVAGVSYLAFVTPGLMAAAAMQAAAGESLRAMKRPVSGQIMVFSPRVWHDITHVTLRKLM